MLELDFDYNYLQEKCVLFMELDIEHNVCA